MKHIKLFEEWNYTFGGVSYKNLQDIGTYVQNKVYNKLKDKMTANEKSILWDALLFKKIGAMKYNILRYKSGSISVEDFKIKFNTTFNIKEEYIDYNEIIGHSWTEKIANRILIKQGWERFRNQSDDDILKGIKDIIKNGKLYELINGDAKFYKSRTEVKLLNALNILSMVPTPAQIEKFKLTNSGTNTPPALLLHFKELFEEYHNDLDEYDIEYSNDFVQKMDSLFGNIEITDDDAYRKVFYKYLFYYCSWWVAYYFYSFILTAMSGCLLNLYKSMVSSEIKQNYKPIETNPNVGLPKTAPKMKSSPNRVKPKPPGASSDFMYVSNT